MLRMLPPVRMLISRAAGGAILLLALATGASADIVLFTDGRTLKVASFHARGDVLDLKLRGGGAMSVPLSRVDRVVDDEVLPPQVVAEVRKIIEESGILPKRSWRFSEASVPLFKSKYNGTILEASKKFDVDAALVSAVIKAESDYRSAVVSNKGARGLMQLMPATAQRFGVMDSFDPVANIYGGTRYLRWLLEAFGGNADLAVAAYNAGEENVWKYNGVPPFRETIAYIKRIARHIRGEAGPASRVAEGGR
jgi:Transglycosylase SLT domain